MAFQIQLLPQLIKLVTLTFSLAPGWLHIAPQFILDKMTGGQDRQAYPGCTTGYVMFPNFRSNWEEGRRQSGRCS